MSYTNNNKRAVVPCPANMSQPEANALRDIKIQFFKSNKVFTKPQLITDSKSCYRVVINSRDDVGATLETLVGTVNAKALTEEILFSLLTGHLHT